MSTENQDLIAALRQDFDRAFARSPDPAAERTQDLLAISVANAPLALRVREIAGIFTDSKLIGYPSGVHAFAGLVGFRGAVVPIYDLAVLLQNARYETRRWLVLSNASNVGFAFDSFEGHLRVDESQILAVENTNQKRHAYVREVANATSGTRPIIDLRHVIGQIEGLVSGHENPD